MKILYSFILACLIPIAIHAQPADTHYGCRHMKNLVHPKALTDAEKNLLNESNERSDTIDILNYDITLDVTQFDAATIAGSCAIRFSPKVDGVDEMVLDLLNLNVSSVEQDGQALVYNYDGNFLTINFASLNMTDTTEIVVNYGGQPTVANSGFGGFAFQDNIGYNLGIGLGENPYNFGRGWFPCFDNFVERSTYDLKVITSEGRKAYCVGTFLGEEDLGDGSISRSYRMDLPLTTYLVGVAVSDYEEVNFMHPGAFGDVPVQLVARPAQIGAMQADFEYLGDAIDELEYWYGPYIWERVGYVLTPRGAMEHATNIAFPVNTVTNGSVFNVNRLVAHELAHHWWGNVTTLTTPSDMWIKEGNAEYGAHLFTEFAFGEEEFVEQVKDNLLLVLRNAHVTDGGFQPLSGIPYEHTYGVHTYNKGASMIHNLRAYLGDSLFRVAQTAVLQDFAFEAVDAETYRDHLTMVSGVDMSDCFNDWIFNPGYSNFEVEQLETTSVGGQFEVELTLQQKLRGTSQLHENVPLEVTFFAEDFSERTIQFLASGEFPSITTMIDFEPQLTVINKDQSLNMARMNNLQVVTEGGGMDRSHIDFSSLFVTDITEGDSALVNVVHHWTAPDQEAAPVDIEMSNTHYWSVTGIFPAEFAMRSILTFRTGEGELDEELLAEGTDDMVLLWRASNQDFWEEYPSYTITTLGENGIVRISSFLPGEYAFGKATINVSTVSPWEDLQVDIFPNPVAEHAAINIELETSVAQLQIRAIDETGRELSRQKWQNIRSIQSEIDVSDWAPGVYFLEINDGARQKTVPLLVN